MSKKVQTQENIVRFRMSILGGLIAISFIILQDFISTDKYDIPEFISLIAFSISLPLMGGIMFFNNIWVRDKYYSKNKVVDLLNSVCPIVGIVCSIIGIAGTFWHMSWIAGLIFVIIAIIMLTFVLIYGKEVMKLETNK